MISQLLKVLKYYSIIFLCILFVLAYQIPVHGQNDGYIKSYLTVKDGLSQNEVTSIGEDKYGFLWFGTRGGLNRYDGYNFKHFKPSHDEEGSLINPSIECLYFDVEGKSWIGTKSGGISVYDPNQENFVSGDSLIEGLPNRIISVLQDVMGTYWIGSFYEGLLSFDSKTNETKHWAQSRIIRSMVETPDSTLWVGIGGSLRYKRSGEDNFRNAPLEYGGFTITEILIDQENPWLWLSGWGLPLIRYNYQDFSYTSFELPEHMKRIYSLLDDEEGSIWVGTWGGGLYKFDKQKCKFDKIDIYPDSRFSKISDYDIILDLYKDSKGIIWVGTDGGGVVMLSASKGFKSVDSFSQGKKYHVTSVIERGDGSVFVGTRETGLLRSSNNEIFEQVPVAEDSEVEMTRNVYGLGVFDDESIWVGMERGLHFLRTDGNGDDRIFPASNFLNSPSLRIMRKVLDVEKRRDQLWVGTQQRGLLLYQMHEGEYKFIKNYGVSYPALGLESNRISLLLEDDSQNLWAGSYNGLYRYNDSDSLFIPLDEILHEGIKPLCNIILCGDVDSKGRIWFGTACSLNKLFTEDGGRTYHIEEYTREDGLQDDYITNIIADKDGSIWFSSNAGISKLNPDDGSIYNFEQGDGVGDYNFSEAASFINSKGGIYIGGSSGYTYFDPKTLIYNETAPQLAFTSFKVMNREVKVSEGGILSESINEIEKIVLGHRDKEMSIEFTALDYKSPGRNQYQYKLERKGDFSEWEYLGNRHEISYQNLKPGDYTLSLMGSNSNGVWNHESKELKIRVLASPLKRWYAILVYAIFLLIIIGLIIYVSLQQERLKNRATLEHIKLEQHEQMNEYKFRFFTNISHELRTPLSLILAPVSELVKNEKKVFDRNTMKKLNIIQKNANRLLNLVNQLIEFRKIEVGKVKVEARKQDFIIFLKDTTQSFRELAHQKGINFRIDYNTRKVLLYFDESKMSVIINNLLNNAFKYCGDPGYIHIEVEENASDLILSIVNDGEGIPQKDIEHIFDRFYQVSSSKYVDSSGIGLALVKSYAEMHKGSISVESSSEGFTKFDLKLKKGKSHFSGSEVVGEDV